MLDGSEKKFLEENHKQNLIIWAALLGSLLLYMAVGLLVPVMESPVKELTFPVVLMMLSILHFGMGAIFFRKSATLGDDQPPVGNDPFKWLVIRYRKGLLVALALSEVVGLYGLVLYFIGYGNLYLFGMIGAALVAQIFFRPNHDNLEDQFLALKKKITS